ncbi:hypothetical protein EVAR_2721_1 [Eumeta japonica]|uniref:Uncharacterized protein n=1 Tax=Eumeta variegata TaxID=151549 RepID=A0A4C1T270_EUMVA|nr:hypothetical protein EVAR_2721_1 [Eumeta japonica]
MVKIESAIGVRIESEIAMVIGNGIEIDNRIELRLVDNSIHFVKKLSNDSVKNNVSKGFRVWRTALSSNLCISIIKRGLFTARAPPTAAPSGVSFLNKHEPLTQ